MKPEWYPDWRGECCAIIASGASATAAQAGECRTLGWRLIAVNTSWRLAPDADVLYAGDARWWADNYEGVGFAGLKVAADGRPKYPDVHVVKVAAPWLLMRPPGFIGHGGNSGFQALNLALQFGVRKIALVGFDMHGSHWHEPHQSKNPSPDDFARWRIALGKEVRTLVELGADVVNASMSSALTTFRKISIAETALRWR